MFSLHTLDGQRVKEIKDLTHDQTYVVVGTELGGFQKLDYGRRKPVFNLSPKLPRRLATYNGYRNFLFKSAGSSHGVCTHRFD